MMDWIKVTPETMPPENKRFQGIYIYKYQHAVGVEWEETIILDNIKRNGNEWMAYGFPLRNEEYKLMRWCKIRENCVTHWMLYTGPEEN